MPPYVRWVPRAHAATALANGLVSHNTSAMWIFDLAMPYRPSAGISHGGVLLAFDISANAQTNLTTHRHKNFEDDDYGGEAAHKWEIIIKENERGAYGIGKHRQATTNFHTTTRYATRAEVKSALGLRGDDQAPEAYKPPGGWPG